MDGESLDITKERINKLKEILPDAFTEGKIDWEKLQATLGEDIEFKNERYVLNWAGKSDAFRVLQSPTTATLVPCKEESISFDDTENIFIEGENLEVLKVLQKSYFGKIKMIYIDPPYNTGNDKFIYPDKFSETRDEYLSRIGDKDETGYMTREGLFRTNSKDSGHYHSNWLSMMYPRLFLAKNLLSEDGVIFVSIDDNEVYNLRMLMNEIFGEENYIQEVVWKRHAGGGNDSRYFALDHEYILVYARSKESIDKLRIPLTEKEKAEYNGKDEYFETLGPFKVKSFLRMRPDDPRKGLQYTIEAPDGEKLFNEWKWEEPRFLDAYKKGKVILRKDRNGKWQVEYKIYLNFSDGGEDFEESSRVPRSLLTEAERNSEGKKQLRYIMGEDNIFNNPKPIGLIKHLIAFGADVNDIILDFFAGSSTTAHAVLAQNAEDNNNRKFIHVQMPEPTPEDSDARNAGYKTIAEIGKERIRRVIKKFKTEQQSKLDVEGDADKQDLGFKVFKLQESNFKIWHSDVKTEEELYTQLTLHTDPVDENAKIENILYELLLKSGVSLTARIEEKDGYYCVNNSEIILILKRIDESIIKTVISEKPKKLITLDRLFKNNDQLKTNTALQMKDSEIDFRVV